jgi:DNA/RNA endonuclease YhcR with UshA esterase domain
MIMRIFSSILFFLLFAYCIFPQTKISPSKAKNNIGKEVIIAGKIEQVVQSSGGNYFFNMGGKFPHNKFTAVIFKSDAKKFGRLNNYEGKNVEITGKIQKYNGKPEIILNSLSQIKIIEKTDE